MSSVFALELYPIELLAKPFAPGASHDTLSALTKSGAAITTVTIEDSLVLDEFHARFGAEAIPLVELDEEGTISFVGKDQPIRGPGELLCLSA